MATPTYTLVASNVLTGSAATVNFTNLNTVASGYQDLEIFVSGKITGTTQADLLFRFNGDSGTNYSGVFFQGIQDGSPYQDYLNSDKAYWHYGDAKAGTGGPYFANIKLFDFANATKPKTYIGSFETMFGPSDIRDGLEYGTGTWNNNAAITSMLFDLSAGSFAAGTTFYIYGIEA